MNTSGLQEFLRSLAASLPALGVPVQSSADLRTVSDTLAPFAGLSLGELADFLRRAERFREAGAVPLTVAPGLDALGDSVRQLEESLHDLEATGAETGVEEARTALRDALGTLAGRFGYAVTVKENKTWLPGLRIKGEVRRVAGSVRSLASLIQSPEDYQTDTVRAEIETLARVNDAVLKAVAAELGAPAARKKGRDFVEAILVHVTSIRPTAAKAAKKAGKADAKQVEEMVATLTALAERADRDMNSVSAADAEAVLGRVKAEFTATQQKAIAKAVTGASGTSAEEALTRLRRRLIGARQTLESQNV